MAIAKMSKLKLIGLTAYKDEILNAVHKAGCLEISATEELADTFCVENFDEKDQLLSQHDKIKRSIDFIVDRVEKAKHQPYQPDLSYLKTQFVSYEDFMSAITYQEKVFGVVSDTERYEQELLTNKTTALKLNNLIIQLTPYANIKEPFSYYTSTKTTTVFFGTVKPETISLIERFVLENHLAEFEVLAQGQLAVVNLVVANQLSSVAEQTLNEIGFSKCPFTDEQTAMQKVQSALAEMERIRVREQEITKTTCALAESLPIMRIYCDHLKFLLEKISASENFRCTAKTFILEGFVPEEKEQDLKGAIESVSQAVFISFSEPTESDNPPVLIKNKNPVKQTEFVTDTYSPPNYREADPNKVVFFFFMLFMGVIMADVGYGLLMIITGLFLAKRIKIDNGARRLWFVIALSGISAIIFGILFNSFFGVALPYKAVLPSPVPKNGEIDGLMTILLLCLGLGVVHIATGYALKAVNCFKHKDILGGIFEGLVWVAFFIGLIFATFNFLIGYLMSDSFVLNQNLKDFFDLMCIPGIIVCVGAVFIAMLTAGRKEKGFGKFTKGFGAVYGIINIMSDILSYARLFGLMLSGMIIATTFNDIGLSLMTGGIGYIAGPLVMVVGHLFNFAMGVLGAYIHNSRLQYIEFFGKFYAGEGSKFTPLGSNLDYIFVTK